ncbi:MAG: NAD(P)H-dependent oxidoreductase [Betaproteobacteria bacterium]|nr:NAD(P)H-dependent oxidoreductase [Betaproteobacteria bacterium]
MAKIVAFAGSNRRESMNRKALALAVEGARAAGAEVEVIDLREHPMPLYDAEWHAANGVPEAMLPLRKKMIEAPGLLIASPEYNTSITPLLKNTIDWLSQDVDGQSGRLPFENKVVGLMGASAGGFGTIRALPHVSYILSNLGAFVLPVVAVPRADGLMNEDGSVKNERAAASLRELGARVARNAGHFI